MVQGHAAVVGTGPNGLAAAVTLARAGLDVVLFEAAPEIGGGLRSEALFDPRITHDICSAVHPMAAAAPFFRAFDLAARGVELVRPEISYAHPLDGGRAALAHRSLDATCAALGADGPAWRRLFGPLLRHSESLTGLFLSDLRRPPSSPLGALSFGLRALRGDPFRGEAASALFTGVAGHAVGEIAGLVGNAVALMLGHLAHASGWPVPRGGSGAIARALADDVTAHGGAFQTGHRVTDLGELAGFPLVLLDTGAKEFLSIARRQLPDRYARALSRFRYAPGAAKVDFLVSEPIPWANPDVGRAGTVHLGGTRAEMVRSERLASRGHLSDTPFVLVVDPGAVDPTRIVDGKRPVWAYAHVPNGDDTPPIDLVRARIERYAPGFGDTVLEARGITAAEYETYNPNYVGGDIGAGAMSLRQIAARPTPRWDPYTTPLHGVYLCSASTPPGPGVHGMSGYLAAASALKRHYGMRPPSLAPDARP
ncbi:NAD(P)/FAD-dependent oxidoreductase [Actinomadura logoneensis]|uniref:NAD(P)/FAD-dependent oxidoreductase n=1 Tax=Actinomadura logoneensis TaxID=2293572 RepID=A0A372JTJ4_9ACTN|nr:NAD(P)/FAD-dependent oxidoreductase [Actinomadura logoneensis]RFU43280.1 NAD(P)/FAD-dependent oxidoreductase [Actinomadura logoneensis]